ncbi:MAG: hypothetical protein Ct9H300mP16_10170 [Pseudomonadota bacterium]|nr:MAG: hypothetical protein Ct9H300mP16_10170 [Pseudomonadota bacterium]
MTTLLRQYPRPEIEVDRTGYGLRIRAIRKLADGRRHVPGDQSTVSTGHLYSHEQRNDHHPMACASR